MRLSAAGVAGAAVEAAPFTFGLRCGPYRKERRHIMYIRDLILSVFYLSGQVLVEPVQPVVGPGPAHLGPGRPAARLHDRARAQDQPRGTDAGRWSLSLLSLGVLLLKILGVGALGWSCRTRSSCCLPRPCSRRAGMCHVGYSHCTCRCWRPMTAASSWR